MRQRLGLPREAGGRNTGRNLAGILAAGAIMAAPLVAGRCYEASQDSTAPETVATTICKDVPLTFGDSIITLKEHRYFDGLESVRIEIRAVHASGSLPEIHGLLVPGRIKFSEAGEAYDIDINKVSPAAGATCAEVSIAPDLVSPEGGAGHPGRSPVPYALLFAGGGFMATLFSAVKRWF